MFKRWSFIIKLNDDKIAKFKFCSYITELVRNFEETNPDKIKYFTRFNFLFNSYSIINSALRTMKHKCCNLKNENFY